jgi:hypothetical protein
MDILKTLNLVVRFLLELCMLAAVGYWGFKTSSGWGLKIVLGIGLPIIVAFGWWLAWKLSGIPHLALELTLLGSGAVALFASNKSALGWVYIVSLVINKTLLVAWRQEAKQKGVES